MFRGALGDDPLVRMRCADAAEKDTATQPQYLQPCKIELIEQVARSDQQEIGWHAAELMPRLKWSVEARAIVVRLLLECLQDESKLVNTFAMQALAEQAEQDGELCAHVPESLQERGRAGSPAIRSIGQKLLRRLKQWASPLNRSKCPAGCTGVWVLRME